MGRGRGTGGLQREEVECQNLWKTIKSVTGLTPTFDGIRRLARSKKCFLKDMTVYKLHDKIVNSVKEYQSKPRDKYLCSRGRSVVVSNVLVVLTRIVRSARNGDILITTRLTLERVALALLVEHGPFKLRYTRSFYEPTILSQSRFRKREI